TYQMKPDDEAMAGGPFLIGLRFANDAQGRARSVEMRRLGREQPGFQLLDQVLFLRGLFDLGEAVEIRVSGKLGRQRSFGAKKQERQFVQAASALRAQQTRPPIGPWKVFARKG